jgi:hypothetical protein
MEWRENKPWWWCGEQDHRHSDAHSFIDEPRPLKGQLFNVQALVMLALSILVSGTNAQFDMSDLQSGNYTVVLSTDAWSKSRALQLVH